MNRWTCAIGALAIAMTWSATATAGDVTIKQTVKPLQYAYPGVSLDILGLKLGMTPDQVEKALAAYSHNKPTITMAKVQVSYKDVTETSQSFISEIAVAKVKDSNDNIAVYFGSPATGNEAISINRNIDFPNEKTAPTAGVMIKALEKKYGGTITKAPELPVLTFMQWDFDRHNIRTSCPKSSDDYCEADGGPYDPWGYNLNYDPKYDDYYSPARVFRKSYAFGNYVYIEANLGNNTSASDRLGQISLSLSDQADEAITFNAALKQLQTAAVAAYDKEKPGAAPKL